MLVRGRREPIGGWAQQRTAPPKAERYHFVMPWPGTRWWVLTLVFAVLSVRHIAFAVLSWDSTGLDAWLYWEGARQALADGQPWDAHLGESLFYIAPPPTLLPYMLTVPLGPVLGPLLWRVVAVAAAVWSLRRLNLPSSFLLWPPLVIALINGGAEPIVLASMLAGWGWVGALIKPYAGVTLLILGRWREAGLAIAVALLSVPWWAEFLGRLDHVSAVMRLITAGTLSVGSLPILIPVGVVLLVLSGRQKAAWLVVPMFLPFTQPHYAILALPALGAAGAVAIALPLPAATVWAVAADRVGDWLRARTGSSLGSNTSASPS